MTAAVESISRARPTGRKGEGAPVNGDPFGE